MSRRTYRRKRRSHKGRLAFVIGAIAALVVLNREYEIIPALDWSSLFEGTGLTQAQTEPRTDALEVHFINVGQGDATLIVTEDKTALIDGGETDQASVVRNYIDSLGIDHIDYLIATHPHADHIGGLPTVIEQYEIGEVVMPQIPASIVPTTRVYENLLSAIASKQLQITPAEPGDILDIGDGMLLLAPAQEYDNLNNVSVVVRLDYGDTSFLFTGDAEREVETDILDAGSNIDVDVLKAGHHGSNTSSSAAFLAVTTPSIAVVSCGVGNSYGHPHDEVMDRLADIGAEIYRTDVNGTVVIKSDGVNLTVQTAQTQQ